MEFLFGFGLGFMVGWIVFQRPQWVTDLFNKLKAKIFGP